MYCILYIAWCTVYWNLSTQIKCHLRNSHIWSCLSDQPVKQRLPTPVQNNPSKVRASLQFHCPMHQKKYLLHHNYSALVNIFQHPQQRSVIQMAVHLWIWRPHLSLHICLFLRLCVQVKCFMCCKLKLFQCKQSTRNRKWRACIVVAAEYTQFPTY